MPWVKGQSGNPKGRPKTGKRLTDVLRRVLGEPTPEGKTKADLLADRLWGLTGAPDPDVALAAIRYIYDRLDGKPTESHEISGAHGGPITLRVVEQIVTRRNADNTTSSGAS